MTAKQYLQQLFRLDVKIGDALSELKELEALKESIPGVDFSKAKVQTSAQTDRTGELVAKIVDLEALVAAKIDAFLDPRNEIRERIDAIPDEDLRLILQKRHVHLQKWEQIALDMNYTYRHTLRLHGEALRVFNYKYKDVLKRCH
jgi:hypothetical protein